MTQQSDEASWEHRVVFEEGRLVYLRPLDKKTDAPECQRMFSDPQVRAFVDLDLPITPQAEEKWFDRMAESDHDAPLAVVALEEDDFLGVIGLHNIDWQNGVAISGTILGNKNYWKQGFGTDAKMLQLKYAFLTLGLRKVRAWVVEGNEASLRMLRKCSYELVGCYKKEVFTEGRFRDVFLVEVFREDWEPLWEHYQQYGELPKRKEQEE